MRLGRTVSCCALGSAAICLFQTKAAFAFRTSADLDTFESDVPARWEEATWYELNCAACDDETAVEAAVRAGFAPWGEPACSAFVAEYLGLSEWSARPLDGRNTIQWGGFDWEAWGLDPAEAAITDVQYEATDAGTWAVVEVDMYINTQHHDWGVDVQSNDLRDIQAVLTHEAGHWAGLLHSCEPDGADGAPRCDSQAKATVMFPLYSFGQRELADDDVAGICALYPDPCGEGCVEGEVCTPNGCDSCEGSGCGLDADLWLTEEPGPPWEEEYRAPACSEAGCSSVPGDPCVGDADCAKADRCALEAGYCAQTCDVPVDCPSGFTCDTAMGLGLCVAVSLQPSGAACVEANECIGDICLGGATHEPVCSRTCGAGQPECPTDWSCEAVENRQVCVPMRYVVPSGCACRMEGVGRPAQLGGQCAVLGLTLVMSVSACRRSRRRAPRPTSSRSANRSQK